MITNIYEIFRHHSGGKTIPYNKLREIGRKHCPNIPINLLEAHRKIYHLQLQLAYWRPLNNQASASDVGNYIDHTGTIRASSVRTRANWGEITLNPLRDHSRTTTSKKWRFCHDKDFATTLDILGNRNYNIIYINEHTIPKWEPRYLTICMDAPTDLTRQVDQLLKWSEIVLRCVPFGHSDQYDLWTLSRKKLKLKRRVATIIGDSIGLGKSKHGSKRSGVIKNAHKITASLDI